MGNKFSLPNALKCGCLSRKSTNIVRFSPTSQISEERSPSRTPTPINRSNAGSSRSDSQNSWRSEEICVGSLSSDGHEADFNIARIPRIDCKTRTLAVNYKQDPSLPQTNISQSHHDLLALFVTNPATHSNRAPRQVNTNKKRQRNQPVEVNPRAKPVRPKAAVGQRTAHIVAEEFTLPGYIPEPE
ncbi:hypothetical protein SNE40_001166 [Patella caerulea]|uniref:Uncharacterized protein n=1 Tax=Patella caerulea TaxID=87958 RepID=A0AAN8KN23_PATCE